MNNSSLVRLNWDSSHFGLEIASLNTFNITCLELNNLLVGISDNNYDCIYCLIDPNKTEIINILVTNNFRFIDIRVLFRLDINDSTYRSKHVHKSSFLNFDVASENELKLISDWAMNYHLDSRFFKDNNFNSKIVKEMYKIWVYKYANSELGKVLVLREHNKILGYIIVSIDNIGFGKIELIGVSENHRGQRVGDKLINMSIEWFISRGVNIVSVVTQGSNISAMKLYSRNNFLPSEVNCWYHYWA